MPGFAEPVVLVPPPEVEPPEPVAVVPLPPVPVVPVLVTVPVVVVPAVPVVPLFAVDVMVLTVVLPLVPVTVAELEATDCVELPVVVSAIGSPRELEQAKGDSKHQAPIAHLPNRSGGVRCFKPSIPSKRPP